MRIGEQISWAEVAVIAGDVLADAESRREAADALAEDYGKESERRDGIPAPRLHRPKRRGAGGINPDAAYRALDAAVDALDEAE